MPSPASLSEHLLAALVLAAVLAPRLGVVRVLAAMAAGVCLVRAWLWTHEPVILVWSAVVLVVCLFLIGRRFYDNRSIAFSLDEQGMLESLVAGLSRNRARDLIDQGVWLTGKAGDVLTQEGEPVTQLYYLAQGEARVMTGGRQVGMCGAGDLVGELTVLSGERASATVVLDGPARFWCAPASMLRPYVEVNEDIRRAVEHGFAVALKAKLRAGNRAIAQAGGIGSPAG
jgi:hypothetical protein